MIFRISTHSGHFLTIFSSGIYRGAEKGEQTAEMVRGAVILIWLAAFGMPDILTVDKDMGFIGKIFQDFLIA